MPRAKRVHYFTTELRNMQAYIDQDFRPYALQINQPTLVVHGTNDQLVKLNWAKELSHTIPSARLAIVEGGSHSLMIRNAQARQGGSECYTVASISVTSVVVETAMALLTRDEIVAALKRLGELALVEGYTLELIVVGGAAMVLGYNARPSTHDIDGIFLPPPEARTVRTWVKQIASEYGWAEDWLNDAAKGYLMGLSQGPVLLKAPGIEVRQPAVEQLLAMKLCAWRDDVDIADAIRLLAELVPTGERNTVWQRVVPYLLPGRELKAQYAFADIWETIYGDS